MPAGSRKIMFLIDVYKDPFAGTEKQLYLLINGLRDRGWEPELTLFRHSDYIENNDFPCPVEVLGITRLASFSTLRKMLQYVAILRKKRVSLLHTFFNDSSLIAPVFARLAGCKVLISRRDMGFWYSSKNLALLRLNRLFVNAAITNSHAVKKVTHEMERIPSDKIHVIYNAYSEQQARPSSGAGAEPFASNSNSQYIGIVANIRPVKRIELLIQALAVIRKEFTGARVVIVGAGDSEPLRVLASSLDVAEFVHFMGGRSDADVLISYFDVAVLCSDSEGFSNALVEYIEHEVPVVCTAVGGNPEVIQDGDTGYLVPANDHLALAEKICCVLRDPAHAATMAGKAKQNIARLCDYGNMIDKHEQLYGQLAGTS